MKLRLVFIVIVAVLIASCGATAVQVVPTDRPTITPTRTSTPTRTLVRNITPTHTPTPVPVSPTGGPSPTQLLGPTHTSAPDEQPTATRVLNPNAPRIEFFVPSSPAVAPGDSITLYWSVRGADNAVVYRLNRDGEREQLWNVAPAASLDINTRYSDRGQIDFVLSVGEGTLRTEQALSIPLQCPIPWFFLPSPDPCPNEEAEQTTLVEQPFERGRMVYVGGRDRVYALFNDGRDPAWVAFDNRYNPEIHSEQEANFSPPPGRYQPLRELGFLWRGNDIVRNRLGLGIEQEFTYTGFTQTASTRGGDAILFISSGDGSVLQLLPDGDLWQIITSP